MDVDELKKLDKQLLLQEILNSGYLKNLNFWRFLLMNNSLLKKGKFTSQQIVLLKIMDWIGMKLRIRAGMRSHYKS